MKSPQQEQASHKSWNAITDMNENIFLVFFIHISYGISWFLILWFHDIANYYYKVLYIYIKIWNLRSSK